MSLDVFGLGLNEVSVFGHRVKYADLVFEEILRSIELRNFSAGHDENFVIVHHSVESVSDG